MQNTLTKNKYMPTALSMYINYFIHGMGAIILAQNIDFLMEQLNTNKAGVSYVISALGLGRLIVYLYLEYYQINTVENLSYY